MVQKPPEHRCETCGRSTFSLNTKGELVCSNCGTVSTVRVFCNLSYVRSRTRQLLRRISTRLRKIPLVWLWNEPYSFKILFSVGWKKEKKGKEGKGEFENLFAAITLYHSKCVSKASKNQMMELRADSCRSVVHSLSNRVWGTVQTHLAASSPLFQAVSLLLYEHLPLHPIETDSKERWSSFLQCPFYSSRSSFTHPKFVPQCCSARRGTEISWSDSIGISFCCELCQSQIPWSHPIRVATLQRFSPHGRSRSHPIANTNTVAIFIPRIHASQVPRSHPIANTTFIPIPALSRLISCRRSRSHSISIPVPIPIPIPIPVPTSLSGIKADPNAAAVARFLANSRRKPVASRCSLLFPHVIAATLFPIVAFASFTALSLIQTPSRRNKLVTKTTLERWWFFLSESCFRERIVASRVHAISTQTALRFENDIEIGAVFSWYPIPSIISEIERTIASKITSSHRQGEQNQMERRGNRRLWNRKELFFQWLSASSHFVTRNSLRCITNSASQLRGARFRIVETIRRFALEPLWMDWFPLSTAWVWWPRKKRGDLSKDWAQKLHQTCKEMVPEIGDSHSFPNRSGSLADLPRSWVCVHHAACRADSSSIFVHLPLSSASVRCKSFPFRVEERSVKGFCDLKTLKWSRTPARFLQTSSGESDPAEKYQHRSRFPVERIASLAVRTERHLSARALAVRNVYMPVGEGSSPAVTARAIRERVWIRRPNAHVAHIPSLRALLQWAFQIDSVRLTRVVECRWMERVVQVSASNSANSPEKEGTVITYPQAPASDKPFGVYTGLRVRKREWGERQSYMFENLSTVQQDLIRCVSKLMGISVNLLCSHIRSVEYLLHSREMQDLQLRKRQLLMLRKKRRWRL